jgi:uncharacterized repeat protein (TIGR01451 family)
MKRLIGFLFALLTALAASDSFAQAANVAITFSPTTIAAGGTSTLTITISNPSSLQTVTGGTIASFTYAAGVKNAPSPSEFASNCGATPSLTVTPGAGSMSASGITVSPLSSCFIFLTVTAATGGSYTTTFPIGGFSGSTGTNPSSSSDTLTVNPAIVVTNSNDSGAGSLRQAIIDVNTNCASGPWAIEFNIPAGGGTATIQPLTGLPNLSCNGTSIDGYTQPGSARNTSAFSFNGTLRVTLDGSVAPSAAGLNLFDGATVSGLTIVGWTLGVNSTTTNPVYLYGNQISANNGNGVAHEGGTITLGDGTPGGANSITGNSGRGVDVSFGGSVFSDMNFVSGNNYGFNITGTGTSHILSSRVIGNTLAGICLTGSARVVVSDTAATGGSGPGIDLGCDGPTANDEASVPYDTDTGPNDLLNYPVVTSVLYSGTDTVIQGYLKTAAPPGFQSNLIELWDNSSPSSATRTGGETFLTGLPITLDSNGFGTFSVIVPGVHATNVSAHVTIDTCGDGCVVSSEFSPTVAAAVPTITVSPASLTFGQQRAGTTSASQPVTITNTGSVTVNFSSILTSASFPKTTTCGATLAPTASCTVDVSFSPSSNGFFTGTLQIQSDATGSPHSVDLFGTGVVAPSLAKSFTPNSITQGSSSTLTFTFTNPNNVAATNIAVTDSYPAGMTNVNATISGSDCPGHSETMTAGGSGIQLTNVTVNASGSCTLSVLVTTSSTGTFTNTIAAGGMTSDQGSNTSPVSATLTVSAAPASLSVNPTTLTFGAQRVGTASASQPVTIANTGSGTVNISSIATSADFSKTTDCTATLAPSTSCTVNVSFAPASSGNITGSVTIQSDATGSPHTVALTGVGVVPPAVAKSFSPSSIIAGGTSTLAFTISNPNTISVTNLNITDNYPSGFVNASVVNASNSCPTGTVLANPGVPGHSWSGISVPAGGSCVVSVDVTSSTPGTYNNQIPVGSMTSSTGGNTSVIQATLTVTAAPAPAVSLNVSSLSFGAVTVGTTSATQDILITNSGNATLVIGTGSVSGGEFVRAATPRCDGVTLAPAASCTEKVAFAPTTVGPQTGTWSVTSNAAGSPHSVSLSGEGVAAPTPAVTLNPTSLTFASQAVGTTSPPQSVTLTNSGTATLNVSSIQVTGDFAQTNNCGSTVGAGASCTLSVTFTPLIAGGRTGSLKVFSDASGSPHAVSLSGTGTAVSVPVLTLAPSSLTFPATFVGATSSPQVVTVSNTGNAPFSISGVVGSNAEFPFATGCGGSLGPSQSCDIAVEFHPTAAGTFAGTIAVFSDASGSPHRISVSGTGTERPIGVLSASTSSLAFPGSTVVGSQSPPLTVTVTNQGNATVTLASVSASIHFSVSGACATIVPGESCPLSVRFTPTAAGNNLTGTLTIQSDASNATLTVALSGRALATPEPQVTLSATSVGFGNRFVGAPSNPQLVTLTNSGLAPLNVSGIFTTGDFTVTHACPATLAPAASCLLTVRMFPRLAGVRVGTLQVFSNAPGSPHGIELSGTGCSLPSLARQRLGFFMSCSPGG